jgi:hypothetical protein
MPFLQQKWHDSDLQWVTDFMGVIFRKLPENTWVIFYIFSENARLIKPTFQRWDSGGQRETPSV